MIPSSTSNRDAWKWSICGMLLLATTLNYMDRQTLASTAIRLREFGVNPDLYGRLESEFGYAFAIGGLFFGALVDRFRIFWIYPAVLLCWSITGFGAAYAVEIGTWLGAETLPEQTYLGLRVCRIALGFFEAAQWPLALVVTSRLLSRAERSLGNSLLQSGTAIGSILTPLVVNLLLTDDPASWTRPFMVIGVAGLTWLIPWFLLMRPDDLAKPAEVVPTSGGNGGIPMSILVRRFIVCAAIVVAINLPWHFYRAWLPQFMQDIHGYSERSANFFLAGYFLSADIGCIGIGVASTWLIRRGWGIHASRMFLYVLCALAIASGVGAAFMPTGIGLAIIMLLIGAAGLGIFPIYYTFSQEISGKHQGKISGTLSCTTWMVTSFMQRQVGSHIKTMRASGDSVLMEQAYQMPMILLSLAPLVALVLLLIVWKPWPPKESDPLQ